MVLAARNAPVSLRVGRTLLVSWPSRDRLPVSGNPPPPVFTSKTPNSVGMSLFVALLIAASCVFINADASPARFDVVVFGGTPAGISAAITAAANGTRSVALIEPLPMISGMGAAGGLALNDVSPLSGLALDFARRTGASYAGGLPVEVPDMWVAQRVFEEMVAAAQSITVMTACVVTSAPMSGALVMQLDLECGPDVHRGVPGNATATLTAPVYIDASYSGDVIAAAGLDVAYGREANTTYNESLAGVSEFFTSAETFGDLQVSARLLNGSLVPYVEAGTLGAVGSGDDQTQAFQFRACLTNDTNNSRPLPVPPGFSRDDFVLLQRTIDAVMAGAAAEPPSLEFFLYIGPYSQQVLDAGRHKFIVCDGGGPVNTDSPGLARGWHNATLAQRAEMHDRHIYWMQGMMHYLATDLAVPNATRAAMSQFGLCADEWADASPPNWPPQLYIRQSIRLLGDTVMTQNTMAAPRLKHDSIALATWFFDQHLVSRTARPSTENASEWVAFNEGHFRASVPEGLPCEPGPGDCSWAGSWYDVPYSVMLPKRAGAMNLITPISLSVSSVVYTSLRIEATYMGLGAAAGAAAGLVADAATAAGLGALAVQDVNVTELQMQLTAAGWLIHGPPPSSLGPPLAVSESTQSVATRRK